MGTPWLYACSENSWPKLPKMAGVPRAIQKIGRGNHLSAGAGRPAPTCEAWCQEPSSPMRNTVQTHLGTEIFDSRQHPFGLADHRHEYGDRGLPRSTSSAPMCVDRKERSIHKETDLPVFDCFLERRALPLWSAQQDTTSRTLIGTVIVNHPPPTQLPPTLCTLRYHTPKPGTAKPLGRGKSLDRPPNTPDTG